MKRGQVSLFVILGIVLVVIVGLGLYFKSSLIKTAGPEEELLPIDVQLFKDQVEKCVDNVAKDSLLFLGLQGGYTALPDETLELEEGFIILPYYYDKGANNAPSEEDVILELSSEIDFQLPECISKEAFPKLEIVAEEPFTEITLEGEEVKVSTEYLITITQGDYVFSLTQPYEFTYPVNLKKIVNVANQITAKKVEDPESLDFESLTDFDLEIEIMTIDENTEVYSLTDSDSLLDEEPYLFMFANRK